MTNRDDLNDDLSDLLGGSFEPRPQPQLPAGFKPVTDRIQENCPKCGGTGRQVRWGYKVFHMGHGGNPRS